MKLLMYEDNDNHLTLYDNVDSETLESASQAAGRIHVLLEDLAFGNSIKESLDELKEACQAIHENQDVQHRRIERKAKMFLSEFSILLNHWEKKAKRQGGDSAIFFSELTHKAYDTCEEYGFTYNLRNYAIHGDNVVNRISFGFGNPYVLPMANRDYLLSNYKKWKSVEKAFMGKQSEFFDLLPIFEKSYQVIQKIHLEMMDHQLTQQTILDCKTLITLHEKMIKINAMPGFWDIIEFFDCDGHSVCTEGIPEIQFGQCIRSYANWAVYPIIKGRAELILAKQKANGSGSV